MNRKFALLVALALLVAHALAVLETNLGAVAPPSDYAHVTYRFARNWVRSDVLAWNVEEPHLGGAPSFAWAAVAAIAERFAIPVTTFCQAVGGALALLTALLLSRFSPNRVAGVIAPLLFVMNGSVATAAGSGSESALLAFAMTGALLAFERRRPLALAIFAVLCVATRPEGAIFVAALLLMESRPLRPQPGEGRRSRGLWWSYAAAALTLGALALARQGSGSNLLSPWLMDLFPADGSGLPEAQRSRAHLSELRDAFVGSGGPLLFVFPLWYMARGLLSPMGVRACALTLVWCALTVLGGERPEPYGQTLVPIMAVLFLAVQTAMTRALDSHRVGLPRLTWVLFVGSLGLSMMASKFPGSLEPPWMERWHRAWLRPSAPPRYGYRAALGRADLQEEIDATETLRAIGLFLRDNARLGSSVLTPWPGAIGYLSRLEVIDLLGRATRPTPGGAYRPWNATRRADVLAMVGLEPDYVVPLLRMPRSAPSVNGIALEWTANLDRSAGDPLRARELYDVFSEHYELVTVPVTPHTPHGALFNDRLYLMRRRDLGFTPQLRFELQNGEFRVLVGHSAHEQIVDLRVELQNESGERWTLSPLGRFQSGPPRNARMAVLLAPSGDKLIELVRGILPEGIDHGRMTASLLNPGAGGESTYDEAGSPVTVSW